MPAESSVVPEVDVTEQATTFAALGVPAPLVKVLDGQGITTPFPVQVATLPDALAGRDILGRAQTGSGKTLGFSLPLVTRLAGGQTSPRRPRGLILVPTRELATQVHAVLRPLARAMDLWVTTIYGGVSYGPQVNALRRGSDIVVATPGRLADLIGQGECDLSDVEITVIDEADQMADLGFLPIVRRLLETTPTEGQRMLFSATLDAAIDVLARRFLNNPVRHTVDENSSPAEIEHHVLTVDSANRIAVIAALAGGDKRSLVFTRTKHGAERLARQLTEAGIPAAELHGNLRQGARARNLAAFTSGVARAMVATDIAARGIHVDGIDLVIHADPPADHKAYVHRSGRTARGGADGVVVTLQTKAQARDVTALMRRADITPHTAIAADADSAVLAEIAGPPAPRVTVAGKVSELVQPEDRLSSNDRPGVGKPWEGRPRRYGDRDRNSGRDRKPRDDRFRDRKPRDFAPRDRDGLGDSGGSADRGPRSTTEAPAGRADVSRYQRASADERPVRDERPLGRDERPAPADHYRPRRFDSGDRPARFDRDARYDRGDRQERPEQGRPVQGRPVQGRSEQDGHQYSDRAFGNRPAGNRTFGDRPAGNRTYGDRPAGNRSFSDRPAGDRPGRRDDRSGNDWWPRPAGRPAQGGYGRPAQGGYGRPGAAGRSFGAGTQAGRDDRNRDDRGRDNGYRGDRSFGADRSFGGDRSFGDSRPRRDSGPSRNDRPVYGDRPARDGQFGAGRPFRENRPFRDDRPVRDDRSFRDDRPVHDDRSGRDDRPYRAAQPQAGGRPQSAGQPLRPRAGRTDRPQAGGRFGGSTGRPGYSAGRGAAGKKRDSGQGRHS
jgi:superfamily II DNA/RNA helicase